LIASEGDVVVGGRRQLGLGAAGLRGLAAAAGLGGGLGVALRSRGGLGAGLPLFSREAAMTTISRTVFSSPPLAVKVRVRYRP
jgi:hypothetical protein